MLGSVSTPSAFHYTKYSIPKFLSTPPHVPSADQPPPTRKRGRTQPRTRWPSAATSPWSRVGHEWPFKWLYPQYRFRFSCSVNMSCSANTYSQVNSLRPGVQSLPHSWSSHFFVYSIVYLSLFLYTVPSYVAFV